VPDIPPDTSKTIYNRDGLQVRTDSEKMSAFLSFNPALSKEPLTIDRIKSALKEAGIVFGIDEKALSSVAESTEVVKNKVVAQGKKPVIGTPPNLDYKFPVDLTKRIGQKSESGRINYREKGELPFVKVGDVVAILILGADPVPGRKVTGEEIQASVELATGFEPGAGVEVQGERYIAKIDGGPRLDEQGRIAVIEIWTIDRDIDNHTGNIRYAGPVRIKGVVNPGFEVEAKSVHCEGIEKNCVVKAAEDISVDGGIIGAKVMAGRNVSARFLNCATVTCIGDIEIKLSAINSEVNTSGKMRGQTIIGGTITVLNGLECLNLSSEASRSTVIFGVDPIKQRQIKELVSKKVDIEGQIAKLQEELAPLYELREQQEQLKKEIANSEAERTALIRRRAQIDEGDKNSLELFDGRIGDLDSQISERRGKISEIASQITALGSFAPKERELVKLGSNLEAMDKNYTHLLTNLDSIEVSPKVTVRGLVKRGTRLSGVHAQLVLRQELRRVIFRERKVREADRIDKKAANQGIIRRRPKWFIDKERL